MEGYFEEHAGGSLAENWMNPEIQTTLLNTNPPKLIATILKALREQLKEIDPLNAAEEIAGPVPEIPFEYEILKDGRGFWDDLNGGYLHEDLVLAARREEIDWVHSQGVYETVPMQEWQRCGHETVGPNLGGHRQVCGSDTQENSIEVACKGIEVWRRQSWQIRQEHVRNSRCFPHLAT